MWLTPAHGVIFFPAVSTLDLERKLDWSESSDQLFESQIQNIHVASLFQTLTIGVKLVSFILWASVGWGATSISCRTACVHAGYSPRVNSHTDWEAEYMEFCQEGTLSMLEIHVSQSADLKDGLKNNPEGSILSRCGF